MNNDRHRYRVWDGEKKAYAHEGYVVTQLGLVGTYDPFIGLIRNINCTVEHCTGHTDKSGNLIYEGDIVQTITGAIGEVRWLNGGLVAVYPDNLISLSSVCSTMKVIGNIHERK